MNPALSDLLWIGRHRALELRVGNEIMIGGRSTDRFRIARCGIYSGDRESYLGGRKAAGFMIMDTIGMPRIGDRPFNFSQNRAPEVLFTMDGPFAEAICRALNTTTQPARHRLTGNTTEMETPIAHR